MKDRSGTWNRRGIALVLGETGATVYVTDIESRSQRTSPLPGTVEDTAEQVTARGGIGIAVPLDHTDDRAVEALFTRIRGRNRQRLVDLSHLQNSSLLTIPLTFAMFLLRAYGWQKGWLRDPGRSGDRAVLYDQPAAAHSAAILESILYATASGGTYCAYQLLAAVTYMHLPVLQLRI